MKRVYHKYSIADVIDGSDEQTKKYTFNNLPGTILLSLENGDVIGFKGEGIKDSVVAWFDTHNGIIDETNYYDREWAEYMGYDDAIYSDRDQWEGLINTSITKIKVLKIDQGERKYFQDSC